MNHHHPPRRSAPPSPHPALPPPEVGITQEEAVERVLQGAWDPCSSCVGTGFIETLDPETGTPRRQKCTVCSGTGYLLMPSTIEAFEITGTPIPDKPLTPRESLAKAGGDVIRKGMMQPSVLRRLFVPQLKKLKKPEGP